MKSARSVNFYDTIQTWVRTRRPDTPFTGATPAAFRRWQRAFAPHYRRMLGPWPRRAAPRVKVLERVKLDGYVREKIIYDSTPGMSVPCYLLVPTGLRKGEKRPGLLAAHGHGKGKADICGVMTGKPGKNYADWAASFTASPRHPDTDHASWVRSLNYDYAAQAARLGYVVIAPDWIPFGERRPPQWFVRDGRDECDISSMAMQYFGHTLIAQNVWDGMRAVDLLALHPNVDARRLGVIGLSYGGTMSTHLLINDSRLKAGVVSGYVSTVRVDALNGRGKGNTCGAQYVPGLLAHGDIPEMLGLAAPKPVLFEMGRRETCFHYPDMLVAYKKVERMYRAAGHPERIAHDTFDADHMWSGRRAWSWLAMWL